MADLIKKGKGKVNIDTYVFPGSKDFIGPLTLDDLPKYEDYFGELKFPLDDENDEFCLIHNGEKIPYEMTLSTAFTDNVCCRVKIDDVYYYFG